ncbi:MAG: hypothetical protein CMP45_05230 [Rickettsiales bacterium]|nr:hypothetical protein [Rickettsiales bacterium]
MKSDHSKANKTKEGKGSSSSNPLADALERLERSVAQREGNRVASLVKPLKEDISKDKEINKPIEAESEPFVNGSAITNKEKSEEIQSQKTNSKISRLSSTFTFSISFLLFATVVGFILWPNIKNLMNKELTAIYDAAKIDEESLKSGILEKLGSVNSRLDSLSNNIDQISSLSDTSAIDVYKELDYLRQRNELIALGDLAIHNSDRKSLDKLIAAREKNADARLQAGAASEILRVKLAYMNGLRRGSQSIPVGQLFPEYEIDNELELNTEQLIGLLDDFDVRDDHRVRAAYLLADKRNGEAAMALVDAVANDGNLDVVREAAMTFSELTGFRSEDLLDSDSLIEWWQKNSERVLPNLTN